MRGKRSARWLAAAMVLVWTATLAPAWAQLRLPDAATQDLTWPAWGALHALGAGPGGVADWGHPTERLAGYGLSWGARYQLDLGLSQPRLPAGLSSPALGLKPRTAYALYAEPGYTLSESMLLYGRLSYNVWRSDDPLAQDLFGRPAAGLGLGAGLRTKLGEQLFLQLELQLGDFDTQGLRGGLLRPASAGGSVGLGWRF